MNYISSRIWTQLQDTFRFSPYIDCHPYTWLQPSRSFSVVRSAHHLAFWFVNITLAFVHHIFVQIRNLEVQLDPSAPKVQCVFTQIMNLFYTSLNVAQLTNLLSRTNVAAFHRNQTQLVTQAYKGTIFIHTSNLPPCDALLLSLFFRFKPERIRKFAKDLQQGVCHESMHSLDKYLFPNAVRIPSTRITGVFFVRFAKSGKSGVRIPRDLHISASVCSNLWDGNMGNVIRSRSTHACPVHNNRSSGQVQDGITSISGRVLVLTSLSFCFTTIAVLVFKCVI